MFHFHTLGLVYVFRACRSFHSTAFLHHWGFCRAVAFLGPLSSSNSGGCPGCLDGLDLQRLLCKKRLDADTLARRSSRRTLCGPAMAERSSKREKRMKLRWI